MTASGWHRKRKDTEAVKARQRKYDSPEHKQARAAYRRAVEAGLAMCWRCGRTLLLGQWHVGHDDTGTRIMGPECVSCNLKAAARKGARIANARRNGVGPFIRPVR